ncbi:acyltransferase family protein [Tunturiibacter gelidoferens]|uniref:Surface polysaccharide O-acyltransferase-like enzyme n=1 Tax=Tunturiibacter gelidiferens TaxID=3069689 RepID=A0A9X0QGA3_9BACT|nr:acyltransferase [Edaphobacter lichenicola]MBB5329883.1 surface polysaccharide O-acyltransferase-like enzyme [Edaphobacter lichenicola]
MGAPAALSGDRGGIREVAPQRDLSIDYLRTTLTLMVLAHHSCLAYTSWAHFDPQQAFWASTAPVVDVTRWAFFDYAENFNDVFFMSLMFFVSGLFVYPALRRHGTAGFIRDRLRRLGLPFIFALVVLMPIACYASWQLSANNHGFMDFYGVLARRGFYPGPPWFIWVLLWFDVVAALAVIPLRRWMPRAERFVLRLRCRSLASFVVCFFLSAIVFVPLLARFGPSAWLGFPVWVQSSRGGLYALWFALGFLIGAPGFSEGLLARDDGLARRWPLWMAGCVLAYNALWFVPQLMVVHRLSAPGQGGVWALLWVLSCVASCFGFPALFRGVEMKPRWWMNSMSRCAYGMYLVHYVFVLWLQRIVLNRPVAAGFKFLFVFFATVLLSWVTVQAALRLPKLDRIL